MKYKNSQSKGRKNIREKTKDAKKKTERGLAWVGLASILWVIYTYSNFFPLVLLWIQGWNMAYPDRAVAESTIMTLAQVFIGCTIVFLIGRHVFNVRKKDLEDANV